MFKTFAPAPPGRPRGRIGLPLALTTYELYPLYARFLSGLGFEVVLSRRGCGSRRTSAPMCYPAELMHAAVDDLLGTGSGFRIPSLHARVSARAKTTCTRTCARSLRICPE